MFLHSLIKKKTNNNNNKKQKKNLHITLVTYSAKSVRQLKEYRQNSTLSVSYMNCFKLLLAAWHFILSINIKIPVYRFTLLVEMWFGDEVPPKVTLNPIDSCVNRIIGRKQEMSCWVVRMRSDHTFHHSTEYFSPNPSPTKLCVCVIVIFLRSRNNCAYRVGSLTPNIG